MSKFKVGDKVRIIGETYREGEFALVIDKPIEGNRTYVQHLRKNGKLIEEITHYGNTSLELVTETQPTTMKKLEEVYTVAPQQELQQLLFTIASTVELARQDVVIDSTNLPHLFLEKQGRSGSYKLVRGRSGSTAYSLTEVSIPEFLELLKNYKPEPKEVVVPLTDILTATVDKSRKVITVTGSGTHTISFTQLQEIKDALETKKGGPDTSSQFYVPLPSSTIASALLEYGREAGYKLGNDLAWRPGSYLKYGTGIRCLYLSTGAFNCEPITIDEFIEKCGAAPKLLPSLAGYQLERSTNNSVKVGCQNISSSKLQELFNAIKDE